MGGFSQNWLSPTSHSHTDMVNGKRPLAVAATSAIAATKKPVTCKQGDKHDLEVSSSQSSNAASNSPLPGVPSCGHCVKIILDDSRALQCENVTPTKT